MAVMVEMQNTGDPALQREVVATIEHALADRPGDRRVSIIGSQANDRWEMKIIGPNAFERSYTLEGTAGGHRPQKIRPILGMLVAGIRRQQSPPPSTGGGFVVFCPGFFVRRGAPSVRLCLFLSGATL